MTKRLAALLLLLVFAGCAKPAPGSRCDVAPHVALDAKDRADGVYGVVGDAIEKTPLQTFDHVTLSGEGVDAASGKRWLKIHAALADGARLSGFTRAPENRSIAVVVGGEVASHHKIRQPIDGADFQVSCCDPAACDRWLAILKKPR
jgi:preprotein translocase subunit SecD